MIFDLFDIFSWWNAMQNYPGLRDALGYCYGLGAASFTLELLDRYIRNRFEKNH